MAFMKPFAQITIAFTLLAALCACDQKPGNSSPYKNVKVGKPYSVLGQSYTPSHQPDYDEEGMASWYGPGFHGNKTANGERYNADDMTAAHRTLPMPSLVEVTNLANNRSVVLRVNDRGPFARGRIIDVSKNAAKKLDMIGTGTAKVRVRYLDNATAAYLRQGGDYTELAKLDDPNFKGNVPAMEVATLNNTETSVPSTTSPVETEKSYQTASSAPVRSGKSGKSWLSWVGVSEAHADEATSAPAGSVSSYELAPIPGSKIASQDLPPLDAKPSSSAPVSSRNSRSIPSLPTQVEDRSVGAYKPSAPVAAPSVTADADDEEDVRAPVYSRGIATPSTPFSTPSKPLSSEEMVSEEAPVTSTAAASQSAGAGGTYIQIGAFGQRANAEKAVKKLVSYGRAEIVPVAAGSSHLQRVRLGPINASESAALLARIRAAGFPDAKITQP